MDWTIPGTVLKGRREDARNIPDQFGAMFLGGGMMLSQVAAVTGLEHHTIQNWVRRGYLTAPVGKKYTLRQLCRLLNISLLKSVLTIEQCCSLLQYVNGSLDDYSDDLIDDAHLYFTFVYLAANIQELYNTQDREAFLENALAQYQEPVPGGKERVKNALRIMLTAYLAQKMHTAAERMIAQITSKGE